MRHVPVMLGLHANKTAKRGSPCQGKLIGRGQAEYGPPQAGVCCHLSQT